MLWKNSKKTILASASASLPRKFQDFSGPNSFSRTFQVLKILQTQSQDFQVLEIYKHNSWTFQVLEILQIQSQDFPWGEANPALQNAVLKKALPGRWWNGMPLHILATSGSCVAMMTTTSGFDFQHGISY